MKISKCPKIKYIQQAMVINLKKIQLLIELNIMINRKYLNKIQTSYLELKDNIKKENKIIIINNQLVNINKINNK